MHAPVGYSPVVAAAPQNQLAIEALAGKHQEPLGAHPRDAGHGGSLTSGIAAGPAALLSEAGSKHSQSDVRAGRATPAASAERGSAAVAQPQSLPENTNGRRAVALALQRDAPPDAGATALLQRRSEQTLRATQASAQPHNAPQRIFSAAHASPRAAPAAQVASEGGRVPAAEVDAVKRARDAGHAASGAAALDAVAASHIGIQDKSHGHDNVAASAARLSTRAQPCNPGHAGNEGRSPSEARGAVASADAYAKRTRDPATQARPQRTAGGPTGSAAAGFRSTDAPRELARAAAAGNDAGATQRAVGGWEDGSALGARATEARLQPTAALQQGTRSC